MSYCLLRERPAAAQVVAASGGGGSTKTAAPHSRRRAAPSHRSGASSVRSNGSPSSQLLMLVCDCLCSVNVVAWCAGGAKRGRHATAQRSATGRSPRRAKTAKNVDSRAAHHTCGWSHPLICRRILVSFDCVLSLESLNDEQAASEEGPKRDDHGQNNSVTTGTHPLDQRLPPSHILDQTPSFMARVINTHTKNPSQRLHTSTGL